ncbi:MAG: GNAT family N-acetyltransferase [Bacteroidia bacterium]
MSTIAIREANQSDVQKITDIYNHYVRETVVTFDLTERPISFFSEKMAVLQKDYPFLVATEDDIPIGYAYASPWKQKDAYKQTAELTIYMDHSNLGKGIGLRLYNALLSSLPLFDIVTAIGGITVPNETSVKLHEKLGFKKVAEFEKVGFKFDKWLNVEYWQRPV